MEELAEKLGLKGGKYSLFSRAMEICFWSWLFFKNYS